MNHKGTVELRSNRLRLRRLSVSDADEMYSNWSSDDEVTRYLSWCSHKSKEEARKVLEIWEERYKEVSFYLWGIELDGVLIGSISALSQSELSPTTHIGYCIGKRWWHQGYTSEALEAVLKFLFDSVGYQRIEGMHDVENKHSGEVMKKCGFVYEGLLRDAYYSVKGVKSVVIMSILKKEYDESRGIEK